MNLNALTLVCLFLSDNAALDLAPVNGLTWRG